MPPPEVPKPEAAKAPEAIEGKKLAEVHYDIAELKADLDKDASGEAASANLDQRGKLQGQKVRTAYGDNRLPA